MFIFIAPNDDLNEGLKTTLLLEAKKGDAIITLLNGSDFAAVKHFRLGRKGDDTTELCHLQNITGNQITLTAALKNDHVENAEIVELYYDQRKLYKEQHAGTGDYALVTGMTANPKDVQLDDPNGTIFKDGNTAASVLYKCTFYDSLGTNGETSLDDAIAVAGDASEYAAIVDIRKAAGFNDNQFISDADILQSLQDSTAEINGRIAAVYVLPLASVPPIIRDICSMLTIGRLFQEEYPGIDPSYDKVGESRTKEARMLLEKIFNRQIQLIDANGLELTRVTTNTPSSWPDNTTSSQDSANNGGDSMFRIGKNF